VGLATTPSLRALGLAATPNPRALDVSLTARLCHESVITK